MLWSFVEDERQKYFPDNWLKKPSSITDHIPVSFSEGESAWEIFFWDRAHLSEQQVALDSETLFPEAG